jgi:hypothetical protein
MTVTWVDVADYWKRHQGGDSCRGCCFLREHSDKHPYGEGSAVETTIECTLGQSFKDSPHDCPGALSLKEDE